MARFLDFLFSECRWYRKLRGGTWYNVTPYGDWSIEGWVRKPIVGERVNATEIW